MKRNLARVLYISFAVIGLLMACLPISGATTPSPTSTSPKWIMDWLENPICSIPCWQGIRPGLSNTDIAKDLQKKYPDMSFESKRGTSIVQIIKLNLSLYDTLPINILISKYGDPKYVRIFKCDPNNRCETHIIFDDLGMVLNLYPENEGKGNNHAVTISANTNIYNIYFMDIGINNYFDIAGFNGNANQDLFPWEGYKQYP